MLQNETQRITNEAETEQFYNWSYQLYGKTQLNGIETKQKRSSFTIGFSDHVVKRSTTE